MDGMAEDKTRLTPYEKPPEKQQKIESAIAILEEALTGYSGKSKNTLIKEAIRALK